MTNGKYNSDDHVGGNSSFAWQFAEMMFDAFRKVKPKVGS